MYLQLLQQRGSASNGLAVRGKTSVFRSGRVLARVVVTFHLVFGADVLVASRADERQDRQVVPSLILLYRRVVKLLSGPEYENGEFVIS